MSQQPRIVLTDLRKEYRVQSGALLAVDGVSLTVYEGDFIALIGPSGCGKTTLLNVIAGFEHATAGTITLDGRPIVRPGADRGVIFQEYGVFPWLTVEDNISFGLALRASRVPPGDREEIRSSLIALMGLQGFGKAYPKTLVRGHEDSRWPWRAPMRFVRNFS